MFLIIVLALAAFGLAATAGFFSIVGLATTYAASFWAVVALGCTIEYGKLVSISFLYRFWSRLSIAFRSVLITMIITVMLITSLGIFGFLTKANQTDMVGLKQTTASQGLLQDEETRLAARKLQIDQQIAQLKPDDVQGRIRLNRQFNSEMREINVRLPQIAKEKAQLANSEIKQQADIGPLVYLAKSMHLDVDIATTWFTLLLVAVLDPLAVILTICTNIAIAAWQSKPKVAPVELAPIPPEGSLRYNNELKSFERIQQGAWVSSPTTPAQEQAEEHQPLSQTSVAPDAIPQSSPQKWTADLPHSGTADQSTAVADDQVQTTEEVLPTDSMPVVHHQLELDFAAPSLGTGVVEDSADELIELVNVAQGPQPIIDNTGVEPNTFGRANRVAWDNFAAVSNNIVNQHNSKSPQDFKMHLAQLQAYVDELDGRTDKISDDEFALRSRILAFIQRHQLQ